MQNLAYDVSLNLREDRPEKQPSSSDASRTPA